MEGVRCTRGVSSAPHPRDHARCTRCIASSTADPPYGDRQNPCTPLPRNLGKEKTLFPPQLPPACSTRLCFQSGIPSGRLTRRSWGTQEYVREKKRNAPLSGKRERVLSHPPQLSSHHIKTVSSALNGAEVIKFRKRTRVQCGQRVNKGETSRACVRIWCATSP